MEAGMDEIKSARELAMEKVASIGEPTAEERLQWKYVPEGEKLAARYLRDDIDLNAEINQYPPEAAACVATGSSKILIRNIGLPVNDAARRLNKRAMDGIKALKKDKITVENVFSNIRRVLDHYQNEGEQQRHQAYQSLKGEFEAKLRQAVQQQMGTTNGVNINAEQQPQFQEEWRQLQARLEAQYSTHLDEAKRQLAEIE
jgi:murein DD-endopeptidase MepM/ murein hydrolase activator NlpD